MHNSHGHTIYRKLIDDSKICSTGRRLKTSCLQSCGLNKIVYIDTHKKLLNFGRTGSIGNMVNVSNMKKQAAGFFRSLKIFHTNKQ